MSISEISGDNPVCCSCSDILYATQHSATNSIKRQKLLTAQPNRRTTSTGVHGAAGCMLLAGEADEINSHGQRLPTDQRASLLARQTCPGLRERGTRICVRSVRRAAAAWPPGHTHRVVFMLAAKINIELRTVS